MVLGMSRRPWYTQKALKISKIMSFKGSRQVPGEEIYTYTSDLRGQRFWRMGVLPNQEKLHCNKKKLHCNFLREKQEMLQI